MQKECSTLFKNKQPNSFRCLLEENKKFFLQTQTQNPNTNPNPNPNPKKNQNAKNANSKFNCKEKDQDFKNKMVKSKEILIEIKNSLEKIKQNFDKEYDEVL